MPRRLRLLAQLEFVGRERDEEMKTGEAGLGLCMVG